MINYATDTIQHKKYFYLFIFYRYFIEHRIFCIFIPATASQSHHLSWGAICATGDVFAFSRGQICYGQRSCLIKVNLYLLPYWGIWLLISLFLITIM